MTIVKKRWSKVYESSEEELLGLFTAKNLEATFHKLETGEDFQVIAAESRALWCAEGSFQLYVSAKKFSVQVGDWIVIPAETEYHMTAGIAGAHWYETAPVA